MTCNTQQQVCQGQAQLPANRLPNLARVQCTAEHGKHWKGLITGLPKLVNVQPAKDEKLLQKMRKHYNALHQDVMGLTDEVALETLIIVLLRLHLTSLLHSPEGRQTLLQTKYPLICLARPLRSTQVHQAPPTLHCLLQLHHSTAPPSPAQVLLSQCGAHHHNTVTHDCDGHHHD
jgi:hypothetical protein